jgi:hypothetical protein
MHKLKPSERDEFIDDVKERPRRMPGVLRKRRDRPGVPGSARDTERGVMRLKVTAECIAKGKQNDSKRCPIAIAMRAAGWSSVHVTGWSVKATKSHKTFVFPLPMKAQLFTEAFDDGKRVKPFEFELRD